MNGESTWTVESNWLVPFRVRVVTHAHRRSLPSYHLLVGTQLLILLLNNLFRDKKVKLLEDAIKLGILSMIAMNSNLFMVNVFASISHPTTELRLLTLLFDGISKFILHINI